MAFVCDIAYALTYAAYADKFPDNHADVFGMGHDDRELNCLVLGAWQTAFKYKFVTFQDVKKAVVDNTVWELFALTVNMMIARCLRLGGRAPHYANLLMQLGLDTLRFAAPIVLQGPLPLPTYLGDFWHDVEDAMDTMQQAEREWVDVDGCRFRLAQHRAECRRLIRLGCLSVGLAQGLRAALAP